MENPAKKQKSEKINKTKIQQQQQQQQQKKKHSKFRMFIIFEQNKKVCFDFCMFCLADIVAIVANDI